MPPAADSMDEDATLGHPLHVKISTAKAIGGFDIAMLIGMRDSAAPVFLRKLTIYGIVESSITVDERNLSRWYGGFAGTGQFFARYRSRICLCMAQIDLSVH